MIPTNNTVQCQSVMIPTPCRLFACSEHTADSTQLPLPGIRHRGTDPLPKPQVSPDKLSVRWQSI